MGKQSKGVVMLSATYLIVVCEKMPAVLAAPLFAHGFGKPSLIGVYNILHIAQCNDVVTTFVIQRNNV